MDFILIGIISAFNLLIIKFKLDKKRFEDAILDTALMIVLAYLFSGSYAGMVVAMVASLVISIFLFILFTNHLPSSIKQSNLLQLLTQQLPYHQFLLPR